MPEAVLKGKVTLNSGPFQRGLKSLNRKVAFFGRNIGAPIGRGISNLVKIGAVASTIALVGFGIAIKQTALYGDTIDKMSKRTRFSTEALTRLGFAAELSGTSLQAIEKASARSQVAINDASDGLATYTRLFDALGVSIKDLKTLSPEEQFEVLTIKIAQTEDSVLRTTAAMKIFGRAGRELLPMLSNGVEGLEAMKREADALGLVISKEQAEEAARFVDEITRLKSSFKGLFLQGIQLGGLSDTIKRMTAAVIQFRQSANFESIKAGIVNFVSGSINFIRKLIITWGSLSDNSKTALGNVLKITGVFLVALKTGFLGGTLAILNTLLLAFPNFAVTVAGVLVGLVGFIAGMKIGEKLEKSFNLSGNLVQFVIFAKAVLSGMEILVSNLIGAATEGGKAFFKELFNPGTVQSGTLRRIFNRMNEQIDTEFKGLKKKTFDQMAIAMKFEDQDPQVQDVFTKLKDRLEKGMKSLDIGNPLASALKEAMEIFNNIKLDNLDLPDALDIDGANSGVDDLKAKLSGAVDRIRKIGGTIGGVNLNPNIDAKAGDKERLNKDIARNTKGTVDAISTLANDIANIVVKRARSGAGAFG